MANRFLLLLPSVRSLGFAVLAWTMLAHASTGVFAFSLFHALNKWLDANAWAGFVFGSLLIALAIVWPNLKPKLPGWLKVPKTTHERLRELNELLTDTCGLQNQINEGTREAHDLLSQSVHELSEDRIKAITERSALSVRLTVVERTTRSLASVHVNALVYFGDLLRECDEAIDGFTWIRDVYSPDGHVFSKPFSDWRLCRPNPEVMPISDEILDGHLWARRLERHLQRSMNFLPNEDTMLLGLVGNWKVSTREDISGQALLTLLMQHRAFLTTSRDGYAAMTITELVGGSTIS